MKPRKISSKQKERLDASDPLGTADATTEASGEESPVRSGELGRIPQTKQLDRKGHLIGLMSNDVAAYFSLVPRASLRRMKP